MNNKKNIILLGATGSIGESSLRLLRQNREKFNLIGVPYQILLGKKSDDEMLEFKKVGEESTKLKIDDIIKIINSKKENWFQT